MTKVQVKKILEYAVKSGYKKVSELKDSEIDTILNSLNKTHE